MSAAAAMARTTHGIDAASSPSPAMFTTVTATLASTLRNTTNTSAAFPLTSAEKNVTQLTDNYQGSEASEIGPQKSATLDDNEDDSDDVENGKEDNEDGDQVYNENENYLDSYDDDVKENDEDGEDVNLDDDSMV